MLIEYGCRVLSYTVFPVLRFSHGICYESDHLGYDVCLAVDGRRLFQASQCRLIPKHSVNSQTTSVFSRRLLRSAVYYLLTCMSVVLIYLLTAIGLSHGGSTHLHTNNTQNNANNNRTTQVTANVEECGPCPVLIFTLAFALQLRKKHGKTSVRVRKASVRLRKTSVRVQYTYYQNTHTLQNPHKHTHYKTHTYTQTTKQYKTTTIQIKTKCINSQKKQHNGEKEQYLVSNVVNPQVQHTIFNRAITSLHFTSLYFTSLHCTSPHFTSLRFTPIHSTSLHFTSLHFTSLHFTSLHFTSLHFTLPHFTSLHQP